MNAVSAELAVTIGAPPELAAPVITGYTVDPAEANKITVHVQLPPTDSAGRPVMAMSELQVYAQEESFLGKLEALVGLEPSKKVSVTPAQAGQVVDVEFSGLKFLTEYFFYAVPKP